MMYMQQPTDDYNDGQRLTYFMAALETMMKEHGITFCAEEFPQFICTSYWADATNLPLGPAHYDMEKEVDWKYLLDDDT